MKTIPFIERLQRWSGLALMVGISVLMFPMAGMAQGEPSAVVAPHAGHGAMSKYQLAVGSAFDPQGRLWVVGLDADQHLFVQHTQGSDLAHWDPPQVLNTGEDDISADGENRPKIAFGPHQWAVISYTRPLTKPYTGWIRMLRSQDGGQSFSAPFTVHADQQVITHRFESIAFDHAGALHTVWIDKRDQPAKDSGLTYEGAAIYQNTSVDGGATFGPDTKVADHSCECCRIGLLENRSGQMVALWRHVFGQDTRDHAFAVLSGAPNQVQRATWDDWHIKACPHHGPGLALAQKDGAYHAVWFGIRQEAKHPDQNVAGVRYARLNAQGAPILSSVRLLPDARAEHADVASWGDTVVIVWRSFTGKTTQLKSWTSRDGGHTFVLKILSETVGQNDHPRLAQHGARLVVVWRLPQEVQLHEIDL